MKNIMLKSLCKGIFTSSSVDIDPAATNPAKEEPKHDYRVLSPILYDCSECYIKIGIKENTDDLYLLRFPRKCYDKDDPQWDQPYPYGKVTIDKTAAGDALLLFAGDWCIKVSRLKYRYYITEILLPTYHQPQVTWLSEKTPFKREGHAEYDKLAFIFEEMATATSATSS